METPPSDVGSLIRNWRRRRRFSQLDLAAEAEVSQRHLSFIESGRAKPSRSMVLRLSEHLSIPLRDRNALLAAAGFAPAYREGSLDEGALEAVRSSVEQILKGYEPHPALAVDRHWTLLAANGAASALLRGIDPDLLASPVNVLRASLHPVGLAPRILNYRAWRAHVLARLSLQIENSGDAVLTGLFEELKSYPVPPGARPHSNRDAHDPGIAVPLEIETEPGRLRLIGTTTVFGTALDIALSDLAIEAFFPADEESAAVLRTLADGQAAAGATL
ncbi:helix-turn-helix domain-containing protein [Faunimonas sp. B44]|uniref:helix-turn-helix domain-containing protein n=1 Tax=Faunimonas sp. B44 TaxID=3461493 RepID=UPI004044F517